MLINDFWAFARSREKGVIDDIDTEFLHEYRVALRRVRSLVAQSKGVFPTDVTLRLKNTFGQFARTTNRLRDLDVYLLAERAYCQLLPKGLESGLSQLFEDFRDERASEKDQVSRWLASGDYLAATRELDRLLESAQRLPFSKTARLPISQLALRIVGKRHEKIVRLGPLINRATPDESVHALRIDCKKLRYALEFFGPLLDSQAVGSTIRRLKKLQDSLGEFNDLCVQQKSLAQYLQTKQDTDGASIALVTSVGGLIGSLHQRQIEQRVRVEERIAKFCLANSTTNFETICEPNRRVA
jgi:CHAD domain-containing protein